MIKTATETIDGIKFQCIQYPAMRGFGLLAKLVKHVGPALAALGGVVGVDSTDLSSLAPVIGKAMESLDDRTASSLALEVMAGTTAFLTSQVGEQPYALSDAGAVDLVFSGRLKTMLKVLAFAVRTNYEDFSAGSAQASALPAQAPTGS